MQLIIEAVVVGIVCVICSKLLDLSKPLNVFIMGVLIHLLFEFVGANAYYCKNGAACRKIK